MGQETSRFKLEEGWEAVIFQDWVFTDHQIDRWDTLAREYGDAGIFLSPGWFQNWWEAFGTRGQLFVILLEFEGKTQAIFPCHRTQSAPQDKAKVIASLSNNHTYFYDFVINPAYQEQALKQFLSLFQIIKPCGHMIVESLWDGVGNAAAFESQLRREKLPFQNDRKANSPYVNLRFSNWDTYYNSLHPKLKNNIRKGRLRAEKEGNLSFQVVEQSAGLESLLTEALEVEFRSWKGKEGTAIKSKPRVEQFYRALAEWASSGRRFVLFALRLDQRMIAFDYCLHGHETVFALKTGYDQMSHAHLSAGNLLRSEELKYLFEKTAYRQYNFLGLCTPWKMEWTAEHNTYAWFHVYQKSFMGWCKYEYQHGWKNHLKRYDSIRRFKAWMDEVRNRKNRPG